MQDRTLNELGERSALAMELEVRTLEQQLQARRSVAKKLEAMKAEEKILMLSEEEEEMLRSFRRFKLRLRKDGEVFKWQTRRPEGVQIVEETALILHPNES